LSGRSRERLWLLTYGLAVYCAVPLISALLLWRGLGDRSYWSRFGERFGLGSRIKPGIWVHAVSVGEIQACATLVRTLKQRHPDMPLLVTTFTPTGAARARTLFKDLAQVRYLPYDLPGSVRRFLDRVQPRLAVIFETELWPNLYRECGRRRIPLLIASARLSPRSVGRYLRLGSLFRQTLSQGVVVAAQGEGDAARFRALGADPKRTHVTGNVKFDLAVPEDIAARGQVLRQRYARGRPVWVAGSTHAGEEEAALNAHQEVLRVYPGALLVIAPRHPPRFAEVAERIERQRLRFILRSASLPPETLNAAQVLLLDSLGELLDFYAAADVAFVGGSLVPIGGHNLLEPAALGLPILTGPSYFNGEEIARLLISRGAAEVIQDASELGARITALLAQPDTRRRIGQQGRACIEANRGALTKLLELIEPLLA
jgi:3-deoxy-D-manno-octulosonic-acid transferase